MVLSTHACFGAMMAALVPSNPVLGFCLGFASHFALDTVPHWDYKLQSMHKDLNNPLNNDMHWQNGVMVDIAKIGLDFSLGLALPLLVLGKFLGLPTLPILLGALGGMAPDFLQFVYFKFKNSPLKYLQRFHQFVHAKKRLNGQYILGPLLQIIFIIVSFSIFRVVIG